MSKEPVSTNSIS